MTMSYPRLTLLLTAMLCTGLVTSGCSAPIQPQAASATLAPVPAICANVTSELAAMWDPSRDGSGGYGDTPTLASDPSLYYTAWSVRLAGAARIALPRLDKKAAANSMVAAALSADKGAESARIPLVERLNLATAALVAIDEPVPPTITAAVASLRSDGQYRGERTTGATSWPATYLAAQTLGALGRPVPKAVLERAKAALPSARTAATPQAIMDRAIPVLGTLSAAPGQLTPLVPDLAKVLSSYADVLRTEGGVSAVTATGLVSLAEIATVTGVAPPVLPPGFLDPLITPSGYYAIGQAAGHGDPQTTYDAVRLGAHLPDGAKATLSTGQVSQGWLPIMTGATLASSFQAAVAARACRSPLPHTAAFTAAILRWAGEAGTPGADGGSATKAAAQVCFLAEAAGVHITDAQRTALAAAVGRGAAQAVQATVGIAPAGNVAAAVRACGLRLEPSAAAALAKHLNTATAATAEDALGLHLASAVFTAPALDARARATARRLKTVDGLFRSQAAAGAADLISTAYGYAASGGSRAHAVSALAMFSTPWGPGLTTAKGRSVPLPSVNLISLAAGLCLLTTGDGMPPLY